MKISIKPTEDIKKWYRFYSFRFSALGALLMGFFAAWPDAVFVIWQSMPEEAKFFLPQRLLPFISLFFFAMAAISRLVRQNVNDKAKQENKSD